MPGRFTVVAVVLVLVALACGDSGPEASEPQETGSPTAVPSPNVPPGSEAAVEALAAYIQDTGLDGKKGEITDPVDCAVAEEKGAEGEFCIVVAGGHYAPAVAIMFVSYRDSGEFWQVHVDLDAENSVWEVTSVDALGRE